MRVGALFVVLVLAVVVNAQPEHERWATWILATIENQMKAQKDKQKASIATLEVFRPERYKVVSPKILIRELPEEAHGQATSDKMLQCYYQRLNRLHDTTHKHQRKSGAPSKRMFLKKIKKGLDENGNFWHKIQREQIWQNIIFDAVYTVESHLVNFKFVEGKDLLWAYAMGYHANDVRGELAFDIANSQVRYDLFPSAAMRALLPHNYADIQSAVDLQQHLLDILYSQDARYNEDRGILARRFAEAYAGLKREILLPMDGFAFVPNDVALRWLQEAAHSDRDLIEFATAYTEAARDASANGRPSAAQPATQPGQQLYHAGPYRPPHYPQAHPYQPYGYPPFRAGSAASSSSVHPNPYSFLHPPGANPYAYRNALTFPAVPDRSTQPQVQDLLSWLGATSASAPQQQDYGANRGRTSSDALHEHGFRHFG